MPPYLSKYFFITGIHLNSDSTTIVNLTGYFTDRAHTMFLPPIEISRQDAINMISTGYILFIETNEGKRKLLKNVESFGKFYLRMDNQHLTYDENDFM